MTKQNTAEAFSGFTHSESNSAGPNLSTCVKMIGKINDMATQHHCLLIYKFKKVLFLFFSVIKMIKKKIFVW